MIEFFMNWAATAMTMAVVITVVLPCLYGLWKLIDWVDDLTRGRTLPTVAFIIVAWSAFLGFLITLAKLSGE